MVAYALEVDPALLPHVPELLHDFEELGSDADLIVEALRGLDLPSGAEVVDLGSGKGAVALEVADQLGLSVLGIDLFAPFVESSRALAEEEDLDHLCTFRHGDVAALAGTLPPVDVAIFAALGDVLGPLPETVGIVRRYVKPGGAIVISDGFLAEGGTPTFAGFEGAVGHSETRRRLESHGDRIENEIVALSEPSEDSESDLIEKRAEDLASRRPELTDQLQQLVTDQRAEVQYLASNITDAVWVLRRT